MQIQTSSKYYTPEEYLELEEKSEVKNEYRNGVILPLTENTTNHNEIVGNFCTNYKSIMRGKKYKIYKFNGKLRIPRYQIYTYPDIMVIPGEPTYQGTGTTQVINPLMIVEVLSKSTINYDKTDKFRFYRSIPELKEYIMINQYEYFIEQFAKNTEGQWVLTEYESVNDIGLIFDF